MADSPTSSPLFTRIRKPRIFKGKVEDAISLPKVIVVNNFDEDSAKKFYSDMSDAENSEQDVIPIVIDSYGGHVYSLLAMIDCIKASKKKIATVSISKSMSCGSALLSCGHEGLRFASPMSTILIHDVSGWKSGKVKEVKAGAVEMERLNDAINKIMDENCGKPEGYFKKLIHKKGHADWYLTPEEAKKHNIINHIRIPKFEISVSVETSFT